MILLKDLLEYTSASEGEKKMARMESWIERAKQYLGAAYDNDLLVFSEGPEFLKGPQ